MKETTNVFRNYLLRSINTGPIYVAIGVNYYVVPSDENPRAGGADAAEQGQS